MIHPFEETDTAHTRAEVEFSPDQDCPARHDVYNKILLSNMRERKTTLENLVVPPFDYFPLNRLIRTSFTFSCFPLTIMGTISTYLIERIRLPRHNVGV